MIAITSGSNGTTPKMKAIALISCLDAALAIGQRIMASIEQMAITTTHSTVVNPLRIVCPPWVFPSKSIPEPRWVQGGFLRVPPRWWLGLAGHAGGCRRWQLAATPPPPSDCGQAGDKQQPNTDHVRRLTHPVANFTLALLMLLWTPVPLG